MPSVEDGVHSGRNLMERERPAREDDRYHRLSTPRDLVYESLLGTWQIEEGTRVGFARKDLLLSEEHQSRLRCSRSVTRLRKTVAAHVTAVLQALSVQDTIVPKRPAQSPQGSLHILGVAVHGPSAHLINRAVRQRPDHSHLADGFREGKHASLVLQQDDALGRETSCKVQRNRWRLHRPGRTRTIVK